MRRTVPHSFYKNAKRIYVFDLLKDIHVNTGNIPTFEEFLVLFEEHYMDINGRGPIPFKITTDKYPFYEMEYTRATAALRKGTPYLIPFFAVIFVLFFVACGLVINGLQEADGQYTLTKKVLQSQESYFQDQQYDHIQNYNQDNEHNQRNGQNDQFYGDEDENEKEDDDNKDGEYADDEYDGVEEDENENKNHNTLENENTNKDEFQNESYNTNPKHKLRQRQRQRCQQEDLSVGTHSTTMQSAENPEQSNKHDIDTTKDHVKNN